MISMLKSKLINAIQAGFASLYMFVDSLFTFFRHRSFTGYPKPFKKIFYRAEGKELLGKNLKDFLMLLLFFFLTILAIGFANDSLRYLEHQMSSPFVRHITAPWDIGRENLNDAYFNYKENPDMAEQYGYVSIYEYSIWAENFEGLERPARARSVIHDDPLMDIILEGQISRADFEFIPEKYKGQTLNEESYGVIVTSDFLFSDLGYSIDEPPFLTLTRGRGKLPIVAIVSDLPENSDFITAPYFFEYVRPNERRFFELDRPLSSLTFVVDVDTAYRNRVREVMRDVVTSVNQTQMNQDFILNYNIIDYTMAFRPSVMVHLNLDDELTPNERQDLFEQIIKQERLVHFLAEFNKDHSAATLLYYPMRRTPLEKDEEIRAIGITFDDLSRIRMFRENFERDTQIRLEMERIHQLENYHFVTMLTLVLATVLVIFSFLSISIYVGNVIDKHLNKIKMNIGTYKAFGIEVPSIYLLMIGSMLFVSLILGGLICYILAEMGLIFKLVRLFIPSIAPGYKFFHIFDLVPMAILFVIFLMSLWWSSRIIHKMFNKNPGDLVYNRDKS